ncbi:hypothetical protein LSH36_872g01060 [Paralvinella palmiformis]|uniref:Polysaccharide biosynthesis domain-containing protein n=1 Tax=Paralvinella palmiformis TaxID=53620 RepID=A0AAD9IZD0_9ANNE|nr:hypothetical protein LSH36_872g01060 [Paralvinella palmiformis]
MSIDSLNASEIVNIADYLKQPAENYVNDESVELQWALKAFHHAETYFNLISAVDPMFLKLTRVDDVIYQTFREDFPDLDVRIVNDDELKSKEGKEKWREFCNKFEGKVEDFNMGTLLRLDCGNDVSDENTTLVPRIQFLAIEIARNKEGLNGCLREKYGKKINKSEPNKNRNPESGS